MGEQVPGRLALRPSTDSDMWDQLVAEDPDATPFRRADLLATNASVLDLQVLSTTAAR